MVQEKLKVISKATLLVLVYFLVQRFIPGGGALCTLLNGFSKNLLDKITEKKETIQKRQQAYVIIKEQKIDVDKKIDTMSSTELDDFIRQHI